MTVLIDVNNGRWRCCTHILVRARTHTQTMQSPRDEREIGGGWLVMKGDGRSENTYTINTMDGAQL